MGALRSGAFAFIPKSFRPEELISTVEQALTKVRSPASARSSSAVTARSSSSPTSSSSGSTPDGRVALFNRKAAAVRGRRAERRARDGRSSSAGSPTRTAPGCVEAIASARMGGPRRSRPGSSDAESTSRGRLASSPRAASATRPRGGACAGTSRWRGAAGDEAALVYGFGIDVTERRALEKRAADAEALSAMGTLALNLAHEIRNPLNAAVLQLHLLGPPGRQAAPSTRRRARRCGARRRSSATRSAA